MNQAYGPRGPRGRGRRLIQPLRAATWVALVAAVAGAAGVGAASVIGVGVCVLTPIARLAFLAGRWWQIGDRRYAAWGAMLLVVVAAAPVIGRLTG